MVEGVMRLPDLYALNEMTPRVRLVGVEATLPDAEKIARAEASEYPYLPVYRGDILELIVKPVIDDEEEDDQ